MTWSTLGVWRKLSLWGLEVAQVSKQFVNAPGFSERRDVDTVEENEAFALRKVKEALWEALGEVSTPPESNSKFSTHLRRIIFDALKLVLIDGVPNAIPEIGFEVVLKVPSELRKMLKKSSTKGWTRLGDQDDVEIWSVPAWELLRFADEVDRLAAQEAKKTS